MNLGIRGDLLIYVGL